MPLSIDLIQSLLQGCTERKDLATARQLHIFMIRNGLDFVAVLGDQLICLFALCGSLIEANLVFCKVSKLSSYTWQTIINVHSRIGECDIALELYHKMQEEGVRPSKFIFSCILKACGSMKAVKHGQLVHSEMLRCGLRSEVVIANTLIGMYAKCGNLEEAVEVFNNLSDRDMVSWNVMIAGYAEHGLGFPAIELFGRMQQEGMCPDKVTFLCVLKACGTVGALVKGKWIHEQINRFGLGTDIVVGSSLVDMYVKCGSLESAHKVFDQLPNRSVVSWNGMIAGYVQHGHGFSALKLFRKMQEEGLRPNKVTFLCVLKACSSLGCIDVGKFVHEEIMKSGFESDVAVGNALVDMYSKCGNLDMAQKVFDHLPNQDIVSWGALLSGNTEHNFGPHFLRLFVKMQEEGIESDRVTFLLALKACGGSGTLAFGKAIHEQIIRHGLELDLAVGNTLVDMYAKCGSLEEAGRVFDKLLSRDVVSCNAMISAYTQHEQYLHALEVLKAMQQQGIKPDKVTLLCTLKACSSLGAVGQGNLVHNQIIKYGFEIDTVTGTTLVNMYAKCGCLQDAYSVFEKLPNQSLVSWSALITGYAEDGNCRLVAQCLNDMQKQGLKPDGKIYVGLLMACSHAGQVNEGHQYFKLMKDHGIVATVEHLNCMIDLLGRAGELKEAEKLLHTMSFSPDASGWMSLLTACRTYGNIELGRLCLNQVICLDPTITSGYMLMSDIYADSYKWEEVHKMQGLRSCAHARRKPGRAWIEVKKELQEFIVGDETHIQSDQIYAKLRALRKPVDGERNVQQMDF